MLLLANSAVGGASPWWWEAISSNLCLVCLAMLVAGTVLLVMLGRAAYRLGPVARPGGQSGTATLEFCLVFPIVLFLALLLAQTTMVLGGNLVVHYAAFAAARTAIVQIPADYAALGEGPNQLIHSAGSRKYDAIHSAAAVALWPVAGAEPSGDVPADLIARGAGSYFDAYGQARPAWIDKLLADRIRYAANPRNTSVTVYRFEDERDIPGVALGPDEWITFGPKDPITVRVEHRLNLSVPYVRAIFADGKHPSSISGMYSLVTARCTLTNEGIGDELPPLPDLERIP